MINGSPPDIHDNANGMNSLAVTKAETGFPGSANTNDEPSLANVVGLPGFILSLPK